MRLFLSLPVLVVVLSIVLEGSPRLSPAGAKSAQESTSNR
uniref:Apolipoprotein C1 n=1 Tax=Homo sapiens TaxID=9606 RepID=K7ELU7_HUMAN